MPRRLFKHLIASVALASLAACEANKTAPVEPVTPTEPRNCDLPGQRDDQGRPVPLC